MIKYLDHFNCNDDVKNKVTQEQIGFFVREDEDYIYISLSRHQYDDDTMIYEEQVGILKIVVVSCWTMREFENTGVKPSW